ncbi:MAG: universal stress protein [Chloroflexi bacterium]|nr:universal stress protein [Chloroflexota bacterium]
MSIFRGFRKTTVEATAGEVIGGTLLVPVAGNAVDEQAVRLACTLSRRQQSKVVLLNIIEVPRSLPLTAELDADKGREVLDRAVQIAEQFGVAATTEVIQARDAGATIVEEARNMGAALILLGLPRRQRMGQSSLGKTVPYILLHAECRVVVLRPA